MRIQAPFLAALICASLTACGAGRISYTGYDTAYVPGEHNYGGDLPVVVRGNPYGVPENDFHRAVVGAMRGNGFYNSANMIPVAASRATYRIYMVFGAPAGANGNRICAEGEQLEPERITAGGPVPVSAVLCRGDRALSEAVGTMPPGAPGSADFASGIGLFTRALFPPRNPHQDPSEFWILD